MSGTLLKRQVPENQACDYKESFETRQDFVGNDVPYFGH